MAKYARQTDKLTIAELKDRLGSQLKPVDPTTD